MQTFENLLICIEGGDTSLIPRSDYPILVIVTENYATVRYLDGIVKKFLHEVKNENRN